MKTSTLVKQCGSSDCGAACLASVAAHFGLHISVNRISEFAGPDKQGISLYGLIEAAKLLRFQATPLRANNAFLPGILLPSVFHLRSENDLRHFVVVYKMQKRKIIIMDPALGQLIAVPSREFIKSWSGVVLLLIPSEDFQKTIKE